MPKREGAGRPKANIDWEVVKKLLQSGCTAVEVCAYLSVDKNTLYNRCLSDNNCDFSTFTAKVKARVMP
jgi:hypothetical protein